MADAAQNFGVMTPETFCRWLLTLDDPENESGVEARRTINLTQIIAAARLALENVEVNEAVAGAREKALADTQRKGDPVERQATYEDGFDAGARTIRDTVIVECQHPEEAFSVITDPEVLADANWIIAVGPFGAELVKARYDTDGWQMRYYSDRPIRDPEPNLPDETTLVIRFDPRDPNNDRVETDDGRRVAGVYRVEMVDEMSKARKARISISRPLVPGPGPVPDID